MEFFDPARVVAFPLSAGQRRHQGLGPAQRHYFSMIDSLAKHYKFDVDTAFQDLPPHVRKALLHGSGEEEIKLQLRDGLGQLRRQEGQKKHPFEGIITEHGAALPRDRFAAVREELARYRSLQPCPDCEGTRLRSEARHVRLGEGGAVPRKAIYEISHMTLRESLAYFERCSCKAPRPRSPTRWCARSATA
jgi:excinuclease ABC subunit A